MCKIIDDFGIILIFQYSQNRQEAAETNETNGDIGDPFYSDVCNLRIGGKMFVCVYFDCVGEPYKALKDPIRP